MNAGWLLVLAPFTLAYAQSRIEFHQVDSFPTGLREHTARIVGRIQQVPLADPTDSAVKDLLETAAKDSAHTLRWNLGGLSKTGTLVDNNEDILVAHWPQSGSEVIPEDVWLWDDPIEYTFVFRVESKAATDRRELERILTSLLASKESEPPAPTEPPVLRPPLRLSDQLNEPPPPLPPLPRVRPAPLFRNPVIQKITLSMLSRTRRDGVIVSGGVEAAPLFQFDRPGSRAPMIDLYQDAGTSLMVITVGKRWMGAPPDMYLIAERFPPLRQRVPEWSFDHLMDEAGQPSADNPFRSIEREGILFRELVIRDMSLNDLGWLADRAGSESAREDRDDLLASELIDAQKAAKYGAFFREELERVIGRRLGSTKHGYLKDYMIGNLLSNLSKVENMDLSDLAVQLVDTSYLGTHALSYVKARARTREVFNALRGREVEEALLPEKNKALAAIEARLP